MKEFFRNYIEHQEKWSEERRMLEIQQSLDHNLKSLAEVQKLHSSEIYGTFEKGIIRNYFSISQKNQYHKVTMPRGSRHMFFENKCCFNPFFNTIILPVGMKLSGHNIRTILHEIGHAKDYNQRYNSDILAILVPRLTLVDSLNRNQGRRETAIDELRARRFVLETGEKLIDKGFEGIDISNIKREAQLCLNGYKIVTFGGYFNEFKQDNQTLEFFIKHAFELDSIDLFL